MCLGVNSLLHIACVQVTTVPVLNLTFSMRACVCVCEKDRWQKVRRAITSELLVVTLYTEGRSSAHVSWQLGSAAVPSRAAVIEDALILTSSSVKTKQGKRLGTDTSAPGRQE